MNDVMDSIDYYYFTSKLCNCANIIKVWSLRPQFVVKKYLPENSLPLSSRQNIRSVLSFYCNSHDVLHWAHSSGGMLVHYKLYL